MTIARRVLCRIDSPSTATIIRHLSGFQKAPPQPKGGETKLAKRSAPKLQLGFEKEGVFSFGIALFRCLFDFLKSL